VRAIRCLLAVLMLFGVGAAATTTTVPIPPTPTAWATDTAHFLQPQTVDALDARLRAYQAATGHQVLVYVAPTTGTEPTEDWTIRAFTKWKVGRKGLDDGLVLFVFATDHKVRIEVGYGLEPTVTDAKSADIIRDTITPQLKAGQPDAAITAGVDALLATIGGEPQRPNATPGPASTLPPEDSDQGADPVGILIGIGLSFLVIFLVFWAISRLPRGPFISSGGGGGSGAGFWAGLALGALTSGGGGGGGFSGFSGGGGMGGGGGATGSW